MKNPVTDGFGMKIKDNGANGGTGNHIQHGRIAWVTGAAAEEIAGTE